MLSGKKRCVSALLFVLALLSIVVLAGTFQDDDSGDFNNGTFANTFYNSSAGYVQLNKTYTYGNFTSRVFDASSKAAWKNFSWNGNTGSILVTVDVAEDVYKSIDLGSNWFVVNNSFSGGTVDAGDLVSMKNGTLYIADNNQDVWRSPTYGRTWTKVNDDYNGAEGQNPTTMIITNDNHIYIFEGDEDVWNSSNDGVTWTKVNDDFDGGGETADAKGASVNGTGAIFIVANNADVYVSTDKGVTWTEINGDYNGADGNAADDMTVDSRDYLYILNTDDVWNSSNGGLNWSKINDDFNPGDSNNGFTITADINDFLYIIDGSEDVFISGDKGITWTKVASNINGGSGNVKGTVAYNQSVLRFQARSDDDNSSWSAFTGTDGTGTSYYTNSTLSIINVSNNRYFQYIGYFETNDTDYSPTLINITINYEPDNPPYWSENSSSITTVFSPENTSLVQIKWQDENSVDTVFIESNYSGAAVNYTTTKNGSYYKYEAVLPAGNHYWLSHANDSSGQWNQSITITFSISKANSSINLLLNTTDGDMTIKVDDNVNITGQLLVPTAGNIILYENGSQLKNGSSPLTHIKTYNNTGLFNITAYFSGNQNYTQAQEEHKVIVEKITGSVNLLLNSTDGDITINLNEDVNITGVLLIPSSGNVTLYENATQLKNGGSPLTVIKNYTTAGTYNITVYYAGSEKYKEAQEEHEITVENPSNSPSPQNAKSNKGVPERRLGQELASGQEQSAQPSPNPATPTASTPTSSAEYNLPSLEQGEATRPSITGSVTGSSVEKYERGSFFAGREKQAKQAIGLLVIISAVFGSLIFRHKRFSRLSA